MTRYLIKLVLLLLLIFTPIAFGSMDVWAFSLMELGILLAIVLWSIQNLAFGFHSRMSSSSELRTQNSPPNSKLSALNSKVPTLNWQLALIILFLLLVLFQMLPLPASVLKIISPRTYDLRTLFSPLSLSSSALSPQNSPLSIQQSPLSFQPSALSSNPSFPISFVSFATQVEFFKWLALFGLFFFLLYWEPFRSDYSVRKQLVLAIMLVGFAESLYGMFEFFSGHGHILHLEAEGLVSSVTGTFINRNYFAGYLLMVIPLAIGYLFSREGFQRTRYKGWRNRLSSLDGKSTLIVFVIIVMILALLFSASRMGIVSLLLSFSLISLLFRDTRGERRSSSKTVALIFGLAVLWAAWIGLDAVINRFFSVSEGFKERWQFWVNTFQIFKDFPVFGSGLGTFAQVFPMYRSFHIHGLVTHAENDFLQLLSEVGLIGAGLLAVLFLFLFLKAVSKIRSLSRSDSQRYIRIGSMVGILALMFHSLVERNIQVPSNALLYTVLWAMALRTSSKE